MNRDGGSFFTGHRAGRNTSNRAIPDAFRSKNGRWSTLCRRTAADGGKPQFSPLFPHKKAAFPFCGKLRTSFFQSGEGPNRQPERTVKRKENPSTFFYIKGKVPTFLPRNWHESPGCITACISKTRFPCGKPGGKKWKTSWETGPFFHKISGKPGGKSEKFSPEWKNTTLFCCEMGRSVAAFCCNGLSFPRRCAHRAGVPVFS